MGMYDSPGFYLADCMEAMKEFPDRFFDLAIVDPPYGINATGRHVNKDGTVFLRGGVKRKEGIVGNLEAKKYHAYDDSSTPTIEYFKELERISEHRIIWGGNYLGDFLGRATRMIVWDKKRRGLSQADCEIAWTNLPGQSRIYEYRWNGMLQQDMKNKEVRIHPAQKPIALYEWLLDNFAKAGDRILDTHVGSGSSIIACRRKGFECWGFEIDQVFYEQAMKRIQDDTYQLSII